MSILTDIAPSSDLQRIKIFPLLAMKTCFTPRRILVNCAFISLSNFANWLICLTLYLRNLLAPPKLAVNSVKLAVVDGSNPGIKRVVPGANRLAVTFYCTDFHYRNPLLEKLADNPSAM
jgi:hypothetical protein